MKRFVISVLIYFSMVSAILSLYFILGSHIARAVYGVNTREQIITSFKNAQARHYNKLFLGNSRVYRGINPDMIDDHTYNFAHDNDSFNQSYYKLLTIINQKHCIDTLFIGADYFQFSFKSNTRNYVYDKLLGKDYYSDYSKSFIKETISNYKQIFYNNQTLLLSSVARYILGEKSKGFIKDNGQYIFDSEASPKDNVTRNTEVLEFQKNYYEHIIDLCHNQGIQVTVFTMPVRDGELSSYTEQDIERVQSVITSPLNDQDLYIDLTYDEGFRDYKDYTDITHLNSNAADRFTRHFIEVVNHSNHHTNGRL